jgi:hypothetical protein
MFKVGDEYRKNSLSLEPGGEEILVHFEKETRIYDKVKNPKAFARGIIKRCKESGGEIPRKIETKKEIIWEKY